MSAFRFICCVISGVLFHPWLNLGQSTCSSAASSSVTARLAALPEKQARADLSLHAEIGLANFVGRGQVGGRSFDGDAPALHHIRARRHLQRLHHVLLLSL